ncbi:general stress protein [Pseudonocardia sp. WMMC193]|uniref:general stress protein n=1 Tax=Pseudonocardia sp. WMMC193 TaxID=2911965 RepID=UPI001F326D91|nr:general stress protein [Pseudonocardia sp. WMMC193]MCF7552345.1 glycine zipper family protein [Pseudonocardia sp. WMMC193]
MSLKDPTGARGGAAVDPWSPGSPGASTRSARRTVASYADYADAERAVDRLADRDFPVERVAIVGQDLQAVEQVTGRMNYPTAAWRGAVSGAVPGALLGWLFGIFGWADPLVAAILLAVYGLLLGAVIGAVIGMIVYAFQRGRRDFASVAYTRPQRFELVVDDEVADRAARLLAEED